MIKSKLLLLFLMLSSFIAQAQTLHLEGLQINEQGYATLEFEGIPGKKGYQLSLQITNIGHKDLYIDKVEGGCHCTKAKIKKKRLRPNQSTKLLIKWKPDQDTEFSSSLTINSNDQQFPEIWLQLFGNVED